MSPTYPGTLMIQPEVAGNDPLREVSARGDAGGGTIRSAGAGAGAARPISAEVLRDMQSDGNEVAIIDLRESRAFLRSHLLASTNVPIAQLEARLPTLLPRLTTRIVFIDAGDGASDRAAAFLLSHGYSALYALRGGVGAWQSAGYGAFQGGVVMALAFGSFVERACATPAIETSQLQQWRTQGRDLVLIDARRGGENSNESILGALDCPAAEMLLRVPALVRSTATAIVVTSGDPALAVLGAQSLRDAGLANPVFSLKDDRRARQATGTPITRGRSRLAPEPGGGNLLRARRLAHSLATRFGISIIDTKRLAAMRAEADRTTYVFDVRLRQPYASGHLRGSVNAPGAELVSLVENHLPVRHARLVLVDRHEVQSIVTAHWLRQMGWIDVHVLRGGLEGPLETWRDTRRLPGASSAGVSGNDPAEAAARGLRVVERPWEDLEALPLEVTADPSAAALDLLSRVEREPSVSFAIHIRA